MQHSLQRFIPDGFFDLAKSGGPIVNFQAVGSGSGRKSFIDETVHFGASDDPMKEADIKKFLEDLCKYR